MKSREVPWLKIFAPILIVCALFIYISKKKPELVMWAGFSVDVAQQVAIEDKPEWLSAEVVILGDSTAQFNIRPQIVSNASFSLALPHAPILVSYYHLEKLIDRGYRPKKILFSNSYDWFAHYREGFWSHIVAPDLLSWKDLWRSHQIIKRNGAEELEINPDLQNFLARTLWYKSGLEFLDLEYAQFFLRNLNNKVLHDHLRVTRRLRGQTIYPIRQRDHVDNMLLQEKKQFIIQPIEDFFLTETIRLAQRNGTKFIYVHFPYREGPDHQSFLNFIDARRSHISGVVKSAGGEVLDYEQVWPDSMFNDYTHLNTLGAQILSKKIRNDLMRQEL